MDSHELPEASDRSDVAYEERIQEEKLRATGQLTTGIMHEILNPLSIIHGNIQLLLMQRSEDLELANVLCSMKEQVERIVKIADGLLDFSRWHVPSMQSVNINEVLEKTISLVAFELQAMNITVVKRFARRLPSILGDNARLSWAVLNMITNARDAMPGGGTLTVTTRHQERGRNDGERKDGDQGTRRQGDKERQGGAVVVKVTDTGCGILREHVGRIFDPFFTTRRTGREIGLGLSIIYGIIQSHGGRISVESQPGKGTTFTICLPCGGREKE